MCLVACAPIQAPTATGTAEYTNHAKDPSIQYAETVPLYVDKTFTAAQKKDIEAGVAQLNWAFNGYEKVKIVSEDFNMEPDIIQSVMDSGDGVMVVSMPSTADLAMDLPPGVLAFYDPDSLSITMLTGSIGPYRDFRGIFMHELGHAMGLPHIPIEGSLMHPWYSYLQGHCYDQFTVAALASLHPRWHLENLNWCQQ